MNIKLKSSVWDQNAANSLRQRITKRDKSSQNIVHFVSIMQKAPRGQILSPAQCKSNRSRQTKMSKILEDKVVKTPQSSVKEFYLVKCSGSRLSLAAPGSATGLLLTRISRASRSSANSLGHCGVWLQHKVMAGSHLRRHMTRWLCYGQHSQACSGALELWAGHDMEEPLRWLQQQITDAHTERDSFFFLPAQNPLNKSEN